MILSAALWVLIVLVGAVSVYAFDQYERAWGRGPSVQVYSWIATAVALVILFGSGFGFRLGARSGAVPGSWLAAALAVPTFGLVLGSSTVLPTQSEGGLLVAAAVFFVAGFIVAYLSCWALGRRARAV
jgi:hypothetical protein